MVLVPLEPDEAPGRLALVISEVQPLLIVVKDDEARKRILPHLQTRAVGNTCGKVGAGLASGSGGAAARGEGGRRQGESEAGGYMVVTVDELKSESCRAGIKGQWSTTS